MSNRLRQAILATTKPAPVKIDMPDWGDTYVRILTVKEIVDQEGDSKDTENKPAIARAFCRLVCEEDGTPVFNVNSVEDIESVMALPWPMVRRVMEEGNTANKLNEPVKNA